MSNRRAAELVGVAPPTSAELDLDTSKLNSAAATETIVDYMKSRGYLR